MHRRRFCAAALVGSGLVRALPPVGRRAPSWIPSPELEQQIPGFMRLAGVPGIGIAVVEEGEVAWRRGFGVVNANTKAAVSVETMFPAASLGKPVFAWAVLELVEKGTLDLDRPLASYFRPEGIPADSAALRITARHVLSHTTGLKNWRRRPEDGLVPDFEPGLRFQYSGEGFFWLQQVVETVAGRGIDRIVRDRVFDPAGMPRATYAWSREVEALTVFGHDDQGAVATQFSRTLADQYLTVADQWHRPMHEWTSADTFRALAIADSAQPRLPNYAIPNVAATLVLSPSEYATFLALVVGAGPRRAQLTERSRAAMLAPAVSLEPPLSWGLGLGLEARGRQPLAWHWGDNGIFRAFALADPAERRAIVVFTNGEGGPKVYQRIIRAATGLELASFLWL